MIKYPEYISKLPEDDRSLFYIISAEPGYYKFGITTNLRKRMMSHYRDFQFTKIDALVDCKCDAVMRQVETEFKREAAKAQMLVTRYEKTEVIKVPAIETLVEWVVGRVNALNKLPQPPNNRGAAKAKKEADYKAQVKLLKQLRENDKRENDILRQEIEILREKIKTLESLLE